MILEVKIQNFGARWRMGIKFFIFKKFQGSKYIFTIFCEIWHEASFYIKEHAKKLNLSFNKHFFYPQ